MRRLAPTLPPKVEELTPASAAPSNLHSLVSARLEALKSRPLLSTLFHTTADLLSDTDDCIDAHAEVAEIHVTLK